MTPDQIVVVDDDMQAVLILALVGGCWVLAHHLQGTSMAIGALLEVGGLSILLSSVIWGARRQRRAMLPSFVAAATAALRSYRRCGKGPCSNARLPAPMEHGSDRVCPPPEERKGSICWHRVASIDQVVVIPQGRGDQLSASPVVPDPNSEGLMR